MQLLGELKCGGELARDIGFIVERIDHDSRDALPRSLRKLLPEAPSVDLIDDIGLFGNADDLIRRQQIRG